jgi:hypothetical protein
MIQKKINPYKVTCDDVDFEKWMQCVNHICAVKTGIEADDMTDMPWMDWYENGATPNEALDELLEEEGYFDLLGE